MENKKENIIDTICTVAGALMLAVPLVRQVTEQTPQLEKLQNGEHIQKMLTSEEPQKQEKYEYKEKSDHENEIAELKKKLAQYESKYSHEDGKEGE